MIFAHIYFCIDTPAGCSSPRSASLASGLPVERESIPLIWAPLPDSYLEDVDEEDEDEDEEEEREDDVEMMDVTIAGEGKSRVHIPPSISQDVAGRQLSPPRPPSTPPLPLSPVSNPTSPTRKRPRTESWRPPPHIPSFFPPFPVERSSSLEPEPLSLPPAPGEPSTSSTQLLSSKIEPAASLTRVSSSANPADYTTIVPYSLSNLASTPEWHLPSTLRESRAPIDPLPPPQLPIPQIQPSLLGAYHHILTHPPPPNPNLANPSRHRVAMVLLRQAQKNPHWEPADSLYAATAPNSPTVAPVGPSYAIPISSSEDKKEDEKDKKLNLPGAAPRPIGTQERIVPLASHQTSRIPELAREALSVRHGFPSFFFLSFFLCVWTNAFCREPYSPVSRVYPTQPCSSAGRKNSHTARVYLPHGTIPTTSHLGLRQCRRREWARNCLQMD